MISCVKIHTIYNLLLLFSAGIFEISQNSVVARRLRKLIQYTSALNIIFYAKNSFIKN